MKQEHLKLYSAYKATFRDFALAQALQQPQPQPNPPPQLHKTPLGYFDIGYRKNLIKLSSSFF